MENKGTYIRPINVGYCGSDKKDPVIEIVAKMLKEDPNSLRPGDVLYDAALNEYNKGIRASTTDRMPVPTGFCGVRIAGTEGIRVIPVDEAEPGSIIIPDPSIFVNIDPTISLGPGWPPDKCLEFGPPGSYEYGLCGENFYEKIRPEAGIPRKSISPNFWIIAAREEEGAHVSGAGSGVNEDSGPKGFKWRATDSLFGFNVPRASVSVKIPDRFSIWQWSITTPAALATGIGSRESRNVFELYKPGSYYYNLSKSLDPSGGGAIVFFVNLNNPDPDTGHTATHWVIRDPRKNKTF